MRRLVFVIAYGVALCGYTQAIEQAVGVVEIRAYLVDLQDLTIETWIRRASAATVSLNGNGNGVIFGYSTGGYGMYLDANGTPTGFTVAGENGLGKMWVSNNRPVATEQGTILATQAITSGGGPNVMIDQTITVDGNGTKYEVGYVALGINKQWAVANADATGVDFERMSNGQYLMTVTISLTSTPTSELANPVGDRGYDVAGAPKTITTRLLLNASKTQILAQAIYLSGSAVKAKG